MTDSCATEPPAAHRFPIVGLGASAGGLSALEAFLSNTPADSGIGFVVVTHLHAGHASMMPELLGRKTTMPVVEIGEPTRVEPNHVYTVRPGYGLAIFHGVLHPFEPAPQEHLRNPIDSFFRSLAQDQRELAVAAVLSGTGSDGALGIKEIKAELGMVMVQDEQSAQYVGMPQSAIATAVVDYVLPVEEMPARLLAYVATLGPPRVHEPRRVETPAGPMQQIFVLIRDRIGHDFSHYKPSTVGRRIERRMHVHRIDDIEGYVGYLRTNPVEIDLLFKELLIGVTSFFRDPDAWTALSNAITQLLRDKPDDHVVRAWVPGCSTGEEAYSLAILLREAMNALGRTLSVQIFATDIDPAAVEIARLGAYPIGIANDVSTSRLARFFTLVEDDTYHVKKNVREMSVFATQNLIADPPFTRLDILCCRNLLIYLDAELQHLLVPVFHYALRHDGVLFLGSSESIGPYGDMFATVDKKWKIYRRKETARAAIADFPTVPGLPGRGGAATAPLDARRAGVPNVQQLVHRMLLDQLVPPTVIVHERGDVVHVHGRTGLFLEPAQGSQAAANVFNMARDGLAISLSACLRRAAGTPGDVVLRGVRVGTNGDVVSVDIRAQRLAEPEALRGLFRISFENAQPVTSAGERPEATAAAVPPGQVEELERELHYAKESHQGTIEELETANEELKSTNEELQSTNEELQSVNEELETSKEEMQSLNEELHTVNAELQGKVDELSRANNDLKNLLNGTDIATVFLDRDLRIKRYTEQAKRVIRLIPSDVGRPLGDLASSLHYDRLVDDAGEVLRTLAFKETEVRGAGGECYLMRILPYRTTENVIDGIVLTFVDITKIKGLYAEQARLMDALRRSPVGVFGQNRQLRVTWAYNSAFGKSPAALTGKTDDDLFGRHDADRLREIKQAVLDTAATARHRLELGVDGERRAYDLFIEPTRDASGDVVGISCVVMDNEPPA